MMDTLMSLPGLSAAGAASFTFIRTVFAKYGVANRDLKKALLPEMEHVKEGLEQLKQKDLATAILCLERGLRLVPSSKAHIEKLEAQRYFNLAEQYAMTAYGIANGDTDITIKIEAIRIGITSIIQRRALRLISDRHLRLLCMEWLLLFLDIKMKDARWLIRGLICGQVCSSGSYFFGRHSSSQPSGKLMQEIRVVHDLAILCVATFKYLYDIGVPMDKLRKMLFKSAIPLGGKTKKNPHENQESKTKIDFGFLLLDLTDIILDWDISPNNEVLLPLGVSTTSSYSLSDPYWFQRYLVSTRELVTFAVLLTTTHVNLQRKRESRKTSAEIADAINQFQFVIAIAKKHIQTGCVEVEAGETIEIIKMMKTAESEEKALIRKALKTTSNLTSNVATNSVTASCAHRHQNPSSYTAEGKGVWVNKDQVQLLPSDEEEESQRKKEEKRLVAQLSHILLWFLLILISLGLLTYSFFSLIYDFYRWTKGRNQLSWFEYLTKHFYEIVSCIFFLR